MSGGENKKFIAQKAGYLNSHFIVIDPGNFTNGSPMGIYDFDLKIDSNPNHQDSKGKKIKVVNLSALGKRGATIRTRTNKIRAYYLLCQKQGVFSQAS